MLKLLARAFMVLTCIGCGCYWAYSMATLKFLAK